MVSVRKSTLRVSTVVALSTMMPLPLEDTPVRATLPAPAWICAPVRAIPVSFPVALPDISTLPPVVPEESRVSMTAPLPIVIPATPELWELAKPTPPMTSPPPMLTFPPSVSMCFPAPTFTLPPARWLVSETIMTLSLPTVEVF